MGGAFRTALGVFTILPAPVVSLDRTVTPRLMRAFPVVGLFIGMLSALGALAVGWVSKDNFFAATIGLVLIASITGAMHLDGLADTADGIGSRKPAEEALVIMRKSDIGPMGVAALVLALLVQVSALSRMPLAVLAAALILGPMLGRVGCACATGVWLPSARVSGFGALFTQITSRAQARVLSVGAVLIATGLGTLVGWSSSPRRIWLPEVVEGIPQLVGAANLGLVFALASVISLATGRLVARWLVKRLGGMTGDTFGAVIELTTTAFWFTSGLLT